MFSERICRMDTSHGITLAFHDMQLMPCLCVCVCVCVCVCACVRVAVQRSTIQTEARVELLD